MRIIIPGTLPSMNEIINASKHNKYLYVKMKDEALLKVSLSARKLPKLPPADYIFTWYCPNMRKDKDNIMSGQKFVFDGLQEAGKLKNDGWKQIGNVEHRFAVDKDNPRIEVEIRDKGA